MIYDEIVNYLLASLVRSLPSRFRRILGDVKSAQYLGLPMRRDIPAQCNPAVAGV